MHHFRITIIAMIVSSFYANAQADDPETKSVIPFSIPAKTAPGGVAKVSPLPHFFPLSARPSGKIVAHVYTAAHHEEKETDEDIPVAHEGPPEVMTKEQATQILSIFGGNE